MSDRPVVPSEPELQGAIGAVKRDRPELGIPRVLAAIRAENPTWQLSEKRLRKFMDSMGLVQRSSSGDSNGSSATSTIPRSKLAPSDFITTAGQGQIEVRLVDGTKGKGVFATCDLAKDVNVFEETPFAWYPRWDTVSARYCSMDDTECQLCARTVERRFASRRTASRVAKCSRCPARFCSSVCQEEAEVLFHRIECPTNNPEFFKLAEVCLGWDWGAPMGAVRAIERVLMEYEHSAQRGKRAWESMKAFATVRADVMDKRRKGASWFLFEEDYETKWKATYGLMRKALCPPPPECGLKLFERIPKKVREEMFSYDEWLNLIGKYSLNDQNGGFYLLQSCFNHDCDPNCLVTHPNDGKYRAIITTLRPVKAGEEMTITYVNPRDSVGERRQALHDWYMFDCSCDRCSRELPRDAAAAGEQGA
ncbi:hypothetical protein GGF46_000876 [Coemansia sp. RSA 552]|nr:hypothetical protein GGF46_000876 [Coemansia sp. RSA 552]